jgi:hypothetical protein
MRTVEITLDNEFMDAVDGNPYHKNVAQAIGYLSCWAMPTGESHGDTSGRYCGKVRIYGGRGGELAATYHNAKGEPTYHIGAVRHADGSYSFHS